LCLDVAHFPLAPTYGWDVRTGKGYTDDDFAGMLSRLREVPGDRIFYVELSDMVVPDPPLGRGSDYDVWAAENKPARGDRFAWTICARPVPLVGRAAGFIAPTAKDQGARVVECIQAILATGFAGPFVFEFFEAEVMTRSDRDIPDRYAQACAESQRLLRERCW